jgi:hypothetical protein
MEHDLLPGETLLWSGAPARFPLRVADWFLLGLGVLWAFPSIVIATVVVVVAGEKWFMALPFFLFSLIGLGLSWGRVGFRRRTLRRTVYLVTDRRVAVEDRVSGRVRNSDFLFRLGPPLVRPGADGTGTVTFGSASPLSQLASLSMFGQLLFGGVIELVGISEPAQVRDMIANVQSRTP